ncbi:MAG: hypothetical protein AB1609_14055 [Bacillota bacterium]
MKRWGSVVASLLVVGALLVWAGAVFAGEVNRSAVADVTTRGDAFVSVSVHGGAVSVVVLPGWQTADYSTIHVQVKDKVDAIADPPCMMFADAPDID